MTPTALTKVGLGHAEALYRAFRGVLTPRQVDECEMWELAVLLGVGEDDQAVAQSGSAPATGLTGNALLAARVEAARKGTPPPEAPVMDDATRSMLLTGPGG